MEQESELSLVRDQARRFLEGTVTPERLKALLDTQGAFDRPLWASAVDMGWPAVAAPEEAGGLGLDWAGLCVLTEELGRRTASLPLIAAAVTVRMLLDSQASSDLVGPLLAGERIACLAFGEAGDLGIPSRPALTLTAGTLTGRKAIAPFAAVADVALVHALSGDTMVLALVPLDQPAVIRHIQPTLDNARAAAALEFTGAAYVPLESGRRAVSAVRDLAALAAVATAFEQIGGAQACIELACTHAMERTAFGQPIGRFQAIKHKLADMYWRLELARGCALEAVEAIDNAHSQWPALAAAARIAAIEAAEFAARETIQTHGGLGVTWEAMPHHYYRRSRVLALELGSLSHWRERLLHDIGFDGVGEKQ